MHSVCLRCGPHIKACERARGGKKCPVPKIYTSGKSTYDTAVQDWHEKMRRERAANFPMHYQMTQRDDQKDKRGGKAPSP